MAASAGPNIGLVYGYAPGDVGWGVTSYNPAMQTIDALLHLGVKSQALTAPPGSPTDGDRYIVNGPTATGAWAGHVGNVALWNNSAWHFYAPKTGWRAYDEASAGFFYHLGTVWVAEPAAPTVAAHSLVGNPGSVTAAPSDITLGAMFDLNSGGTLTTTGLATSASVTSGDSAVTAAFVAADSVVTAAFVSADSVVTAAFVAADSVVAAAFAAADTAVTAAFVSADSVVTAAFVAADSVVTAAFVAADNAAAAAAAIGAHLLAGNPGSVSAIPSGITIGAGLTLSGSTLSSTALGEALFWAGTWNASTNSPTLTSGSGTNGALYTVTTAGTTTVDTLSSWDVGDKIAFDGVSSVWRKIDGHAIEVATVAGRTGAVVLTGADIGLNLGVIDYTAAKLLVANGSSYASVAMSGAGTINAGGTMTLGSIVSGGTFGDSTHVGVVVVGNDGRVTSASSTAIVFPGTGAPSGTAGGVLAGNYPNPSFAASPTFTVVGSTAPMVLNGNTAFTASGLTGTELHIAGADTISARLLLDAYGASGILTARRAGGTQAAPTALAMNDQIFQITAIGHDGTSYSGSVGGLNFQANQAHSPTARGTKWVVNTVNVGTTVATTKMVIADHVLIGTTTDAGSFNLQVIGTAVVDSLILGASTNTAITSFGTVGLAIVSGVLDFKTSGTNTIKGNTGSVAAIASDLTIGNGIFKSGTTLSAQNVGTVTCTTTGTINPANIDLALVNLGTTNTVLSALPGFPYQRMRAHIAQGATAHTVTMDGTTIVFGTDITAYTAGTLTSKCDHVMMIANSTGSIWTVDAVNHGCVL